MSGEGNKKIKIKKFKKTLDKATPIGYNSSVRSERATPTVTSKGKLETEKNLKKV